MALEDLRFQVATLHIQPGDTLHLILSRHVAPDELDAIRDQLFRILPKGVTVIILPPDVSLTHTPA